MEMKFESYYGKDQVFKMTFTELTTKFENGWITEDDILAYIRFCGVGKFRMNALALPAGVDGFFKTGEPEMTLCRIVDDENPLYNPLRVANLDEEQGHWNTPHKIRFTPVNYSGNVETMYFSDFCSHVRDGSIEIEDCGDKLFEE